MTTDTSRLKPVDGRRVWTAACGAHSSVGGVQVDDGLCAWGELQVVGRVREIGGSKVRDADLPGPIEHQPQATATLRAIGEPEPAHIGVAALLLRADVWHVLVPDG
jgi:hypothetical protein